MNTYSSQTHNGSRRGTAIAWTDEHQATTSVVAIAAAVVAGVVLGILFSLALSGTGSASLHRAGGHAMATVAQAQHAAVAAVAAVGGNDVAAAHVERTRSPARGGFAVGRSNGAGSGVIALKVATHGMAHGFPGRSLGAGRAPATALARPTASES